MVAASLILLCDKENKGSRRRSIVLVVRGDLWLCCRKREENVNPNVKLLLSDLNFDDLSDINVSIFSSRFRLVTNK